jgi:hypothetical protein
MKSLYVLLLFSLCAATPPGGFKKIFNGKNLSGWTVHGTEKWYVQKGELVCESGPDKQYGYLSTIRNTTILSSP